MPDARLDFGLGILSFSAEGSEGWLAEQFDKVIAQLEELDLSKEGRSPNAPASPIPPGQPPATDSQIGSTTLVAFLQKCSATSNGNKKFLATALWVMGKQAKNTFTAKDVTSALSTAQQSRLANPSQSLARVTKAGHAEVSSNGEYYVTPEGRKELGLQEEAA
jgi:hypothetical protein